ncbi:MAG: hypothetical protein HYW49_10985 [Deltaproteobacteria bacterium]|nr:hypothetical protein [Deltaproteobacteria bacterium]
MRKLLLAAALAVCACAVLQSCGVKAPPLPPLSKAEQLREEELEREREAKRARQRAAIDERNRQLEAEKQRNQGAPKTGE